MLRLGSAPPLAAIVAAIATAACSEAGRATRAEPVETTRAAVVSGALDTDDPAVAAILPRRSACAQPTPTPTCTGVLIAPRVVLTAAHCINDPSLRLEVYFGASTVDGSGRFDVVTAVSVHPKFDAKSHAFDVALLRLADDPGIAPVSMGTFDAVIGASARVVGFGVDGSPTSVPGIKRAGVTTVTSFEAGSFRTAPGPSMSCAGDSGGPVLIRAADAGAELLVGVTSYGDSPCKEFAVNARVDAVRDFIDPFVAETEATPAGMSSGTISLDSICGRRCASPDECPAGLACGAFGGGTCLVNGGAPMGYGEECSAASPCVTGALCARVWPSGPGACRCALPCAGAPTAPMPSTSTSSSATEPLATQAGGGGCAWAPRSRSREGQSIAPFAPFGLAALAGVLRRLRARSAQP